MFHDARNGLPLFDELETYLLYEDGVIKGFIQYGTAIDRNQSKNHMIRNMHYEKD